MACSPSVEPLEPILIEERSKRRLAERRLPDDAKQRGRRLVLVALQWRQNRGALGRVTIKRVRTGPEPELDEGSPLGRGQCEMSNLVQDDVSLGRAT